METRREEGETNGKEATDGKMIERGRRAIKESSEAGEEEQSRRREVSALGSFLSAELI